MKKYKLYVISVIGTIAILLLFLFLASNNQEQPIPTKESANDENMVYFDVNSQNTPDIQQPQTQQAIDESELNADQYNQQMAQNLTGKPSVNLPNDEETPTETFIIPSSPRPKHRHRATKQYQYRAQTPQYSYKKPSVLHKILQPGKKLLAKAKPCLLPQLPFIPMPPCFRTLQTVNLDYANAYEVAEFINKNIPTEDSSLATAKGNKEIVLNGTEHNIETAQKIIALLDTHPKLAVYKLNYTKPSKMANMIANSVFGGNCTVSSEGDENCNRAPLAIYYNNAQNSITIVGASSKQLDMAQDFINFSDVKLPQAFLDIMVVEFNEKGSAQFQKLSQFNVNCESEYGITSQNIYSSISNIICNGGGKVLAKPRLTIANDSDYNISVTSDYVQSRQSKYVYNIADCGTKLKIHSVINPKGEVFLTLEPHYITVKRSIPSERNPKATLFNRKCFHYENIKLHNCQTLCFGGVNSQQEYMSFGRKKTVNTELMMFVNVHVLD